MIEFLLVSGFSGLIRIVISFDVKLCFVSCKTYICLLMCILKLEIKTNCLLFMAKLLIWLLRGKNFYVDFHTKCENPHIAIVQFSRLGRQFP